MLLIYDADAREQLKKLLLLVTSSSVAMQVKNVE